MVALPRPSIPSGKTRNWHPKPQCHGFFCIEALSLPRYRAGFLSEVRAKGRDLLAAFEQHREPAGSCQAKEIVETNAPSAAGSE